MREISVKEILLKQVFVFELKKRGGRLPALKELFRVWIRASFER